MKTLIPSFTNQEAKMAREWVSECADCGCYRDVDADYVENEASDEECVRCVVRTYAGGWSQFLADSQPISI